MKFKIGCGCVLVSALMLVGIIVRDCWKRSYEFELDICRRVPDLNQYPIICAKVDEDFPDYYGYVLYRNPMRENGIASLILTDGMSRHADALFGVTRIRPSGLKPMEGKSCFFGELPVISLSEQPDAIGAVQRLQPVRDARAAIEANAVLPCRWYNEPRGFDVKRWVCIWSGIGATWEVAGFWKDRESKDEATCAAKEAMTACAIKAVFQDMRTPRIDEESPVEEDFFMRHGRVPVLVRTSVVTRRKFTFYSATGVVFARLSIIPAHSRLLREDLSANLARCQAIFRQVFLELKTAKGAATIRGRSYYDAANDTGVIRDLERTEKP